MIPWESLSVHTDELLSHLTDERSANARCGYDREDNTRKMKRNHDFSSSDSELDENIEVEKESADENA